jgi:hypothetical protein
MCRVFVRPTSVASIGLAGDAGNHVYDVHDFLDALGAGNLPAGVGDRTACSSVEHSRAGIARAKYKPVPGLCHNGGNAIRSATIWARAQDARWPPRSFRSMGKRAGQCRYIRSRGLEETHGGKQQRQPGCPLPCITGLSSFLRYHKCGPFSPVLLQLQLSIPARLHSNPAASRVFRLALGGGESKALNAPAALFGTPSGICCASRNGLRERVRRSPSVRQFHNTSQDGCPLWASLSFNQETSVDLQSVDGQVL